MRGIDEKYGAPPCLSIFQARLNHLMKIGGLFIWIGFGGNHPNFSATQMEFFLRRLPLEWDFA